MQLRTSILASTFELTQQTIDNDIQCVPIPEIMVTGIRIGVCEGWIFLLNFCRQSSSYRLALDLGSMATEITGSETPSIQDNGWSPSATSPGNHSDRRLLQSHHFEFLQAHCDGWRASEVYDQCSASLCCIDDIGSGFNGGVNRKKHSLPTYGSTIF